MKTSMMLSELVRAGQELLAESGDMGVYVGNMEGLTPSDFQTVEAAEPEKHGERFVHIGEW